MESSELPPPPDDAARAPAPAFGDFSSADELRTRAGADPQACDWMHLIESGCPQASTPVRISPLASELPSIPGYTIIAELGRGGMGVVYKAWQIKLQRHVALKMVLCGSLAGPEQLIRFLAEAETLARLQHPNIVRIHEIGTFDRRPYFALEYIEGIRLSDLLGGAPQSAAFAAALLEKVARAIHFAHEQGIVHRDLKPSNILLESNRPAASGGNSTAAPRGDELPPVGVSLSPKITDFGLAKHINAGPGITRTNEVLGTEPYMSPEQAQGRAEVVGPAADIYSLGVLLYEMLTGQPPFRAANAMETIVQVLSLEPRSIDRIQPKTPRDLVTICMKCLEKEPGNRYQSAEALADDLRRFLAGDPIRARPATNLERLWKWTRRRPAIAALSFSLLVVILLGLGSSTWGWWHAANARDEMARTEIDALRARDEARAIQAREAAAREQLEIEVAASYVAQAEMLYRRGRPTEAQSLLDRCPAEQRDWPWRCVQQWLKPGATPFARIAHTDEPIVALSPSTDRAQVVYLTSAGKLGAGSATEGMRQPTGRLSGGGAASVALAAFARDCPRFVTVHETGHVRVWEGHVEPKPIAAVAPAPGQAVRVVISPGGRRAAILFEAPADKARQISVWEQDKGTILAPFSCNATALALGPGSAPLATGEADAPRSSPCIALRETTSGRVQTRLEWPGCPQASARNLAYSADGKLLAADDGCGHLAIWEPATGKPVHPRLLDCLPNACDLAFSPDGRLLAIAAGSEVEVWNVAAGQKVLPLETKPERPAAPGFAPHIAWSRDGACLAVSQPDNGMALWNGGR